MPSRLILLATVCLGLVASATAMGAGTKSSAAGLCAFRESTTRDGLVATATIHVVQDNCQLSFVSISKGATLNTIYNTTTGTYAASEDRVKMQVQLPCGVSSETDVVLGPPTLYPPTDLDLGATAFPEVACPAGGGSTGGGGGGGGGGGTGGGGTGGGGGGGGGTGGGGGGGTGGGGGGGGTGGGGGPLPDLATTISTTRKTTPHVGDIVPFVVKITNRGAAAAGGVHVLISLSPNSLSHGKAVASRGPGCTGVTVLDCNLGSLGKGSSTTVSLRLSAASGRRFGLGAHAQEIQNDATLEDNAGTLTLKVLPRVLRFKLGARAARVVANDQLVYIALTGSASVSAQVYVGGHAQPIRWRRSLSAGTVIVRIPLPKLNHGQRFALVLRAKHGKAVSTVRLQLRR